MKTTKKKLKVFIIAGEVSGDVLGAKIMREMPDVDFIGIGGQHMESCGLKSIFPNFIVLVKDKIYFLQFYRHR
jgi:lipid-A-disaccharide synthase